LSLFSLKHNNRAGDQRKRKKQGWGDDGTSREEGTEDENLLRGRGKRAAKKKIQQSSNTGKGVEKVGGGVRDGGGCYIL